MQELHRFADWEDRLKTYLDRVAEDPFEWGTHDCGLFVADCIKAQTGVDPAEAFRGRYDSRLGAARTLRELAQGTLLKTVRHWLGAPVCIHHAHRGDIVMLNSTTLGVCVGHHSWFVGRNIEGQERLTLLRTAECRHAFRVPFAPRAVANV